MAITFPLLLALAAIHWVLSWHVLSSNRHALANRAFALFAFCAGLWTIGVALTHHPAGHTRLFAILTFLLANLMIFAFVRMAFITAGAHRSWRLARLFFLLITGCSSIVATTPSLVVTARIINGALTIQYGAAHPFYALYVLVCVLAGFGVLVYRYRLVSGVSRVRLRYLIIGLLLPAVGVLTTNLAAPLLFKRTHLGIYGPLFLVIFFLVTAHAFIRYRLLDVTLVIRRSVTWVLAVLASLVPLLLSLMFFWPFFSTKFQPLELALLLVGSTVIGLLTPIMRDATGRALDKYIYRSRTNYQKTLKQASRLLTRVLDLEELLELIGKAIVESTSASFVAIFLRRDDDVFHRVSQNVATESIQPDTSPILPKTIWTNLLATKEPLEVEHSLRHVDTNPSCPSDAGTEVKGALLLPIVSDDDLIGVVALGKKMSGDPFYSQDVDLLSTLANQAGVAIKNAQLYEQVVLINEYLQNIVGTIESGVIAVNRSEHITIFNRAAEQLTGLAGDGIRGRSISELPAVLGGPLRATAADGQQRVLAEVELARADGSALPVICLTSPLREPAGGLLGAVAVFSDLTPLKQLETERRRAERLAYFEALAAGIAHEIKNPLVAIKTFTQLLPRKSPHDEQFRESFVRIVGREVDRMQHLVDRLRALAKPNARPHHVLDVRGPITDALELLQPRLEEKGIAAIWTPGATPRPVLGDQGGLEQLFLNLLLNALEAMEPGGTLTVRLAGLGGRTVVEIEDTGPGIPEELLANIFDPFVTTKLHGSGLGLAICASIANTHRASIRVANKSEGRGAIFTIEFPAEAMTPTHVDA